jgi:hypothetical protein
MIFWTHNVTICDEAKRTERKCDNHQEGMDGTVPGNIRDLFPEMMVVAPDCAVALKECICCES